MSRTRRIATAMIAVAVTLALAACSSGGDDDPAADGDAAAPATTAPDGPTETSGFPEGSFEHTATVEEAMGNGFTRLEARQAFGEDGELPITFVFEDGSWQQIEMYEDGASEVGDYGTYTVEGDEVLMVSESDGCPGCVGTYRWTFDGQTLGLVLVSDSAGEEDAHDVRLHTEYEFEQVA